MLFELHVENFILIRTLDAEFAPGLNVVTGETGTGKSILLEAVGLLAGGRGFEDQVRSGFAEAKIQGAFHVDKLAEVGSVLAAKGLSGEEGEVILSRRIQSGGPNRCRVNGQLTTLADLTEVGSALMDIQSQGEHYSLLSPKQHLRILDAYSGEQLLKIKQSYKQLYRQYQELVQELSRLNQSEQERMRELDMLRFQLREIASAGFTEGEDEALEERRNILRNAEKLSQETSRAYALLKQGVEEAPGAIDLLHETGACLEKIAKVDGSWVDTVSDYAGLLSSLEELAERVRDYLEGLEFDTSDLDRIESRLASAEALKRKYGPELGDVLAYAKEAQSRMELLDGSDQRKDDLELEISSLSCQLKKMGLALREARLKAASKLQDAVREGLGELRLADSDFRVAVDPLPGEDFSEEGLDSVAFSFSANPGEPLKPLHKVASGGELSRLLLTLKGALAAVEGVPVLVFDEIDTGTSGRAAQAIAEKLYQLSRDYQVICVTHLPQIAAMGDRHFLLQKQVDSAGENTEVTVTILEVEERANELGRLLGGVSVTDATMKAARDLLQQADAYKKLCQGYQA